MKLPHHATHVLLATAILVFQGLLSAAPKPESSAPREATVSNNQSNPLEITIAGEPNNRVGDAAYVVISLRNISGAQLQLKNMTVSIDGPAKERFVAPLECPLQRDGEVELASGAVFEQTCRFEMKPARVWPGGSGLQSSLLSADIRLQVIAELTKLGNFQYFPTFMMKAPEISIFIGGFFGALMLALFVLVERILRNPEARQAWVRTALVTLVMGLRGGLMAIIALLISKTTQSVGSPVSLTVADFSGGILVGLFSYPLATWISSTLKLDANFIPHRSSSVPEK